MTACASHEASRAQGTPTPRPSAVQPSPTARDVDPCVTPNTIVTRKTPYGGAWRTSDRVSSLGPYVGGWNVHGEEMVLRANGTGYVSSHSAEYQERDLVRLTRYRKPDRLVMEVVEVTYTTPAGAPRPAPTDDCSLADGLVQPGDMSVLHFVAPHVLYESVAVSHLAPFDIKGNGGNPYWCGDGASTAHLRDCGL